MLRAHATQIRTRESVKNFDAYIICTSPRSGSTLLCKLLQSVKGAGHPDSHFHQPSLEAWLDDYGLQRSAFGDRKAALQAVFQSARARGTGDGGVFGLRMQGHTFPFFRKQLGVLHPTPPGDRARIDAAFGKTLFIHLTRENKLDQAISLVRAEQSGLWHRAADGSELERLSEPQAPHYDADAIAAERDEFKQMDAAWADWFAEQAIAPLRLTYSELADAPYPTLHRVLAALGLEAKGLEGKTPPVAKLADEINRDWAQRFQADSRF